MKKPSRSKIVAQRRIRQWLHWELLQRATSYKDAVAHFLNTIQEMSKYWKDRLPPHPDLPVSTDSQTFRIYYDRLEECMRHIVACERIVTTYERLTRRLGAELTQQERESLDADDGADYKKLRSEVLGIVAEGCLCHNLWGCTDLLSEFQERWGVQFPLDPGLTAVVWELLTLSTQPSVQLHSWTPEGATIWVPFNLSRERVHAEITLTLAALDQMASTQGRRRPQRDKDNFQGIANPRKYYKEALEAYDLDQQHLTKFEIAQKLWPEEVVSDREKYEKEYFRFPSIQKAHDRINAIKRLITNIQEQIKYSPHLPRNNCT